METETENRIETSFVKIGNDYINLINIERFIEIEGDLYLTTIAGKERTLHERTANDNFTMDGLIRKLNEKAHDIIYIQAFTQNDESVFDEDKASNLLYRKWLARAEKEKRK